MIFKHPPLSKEEKMMGTLPDKLCRRDLPIRFGIAHALQELALELLQ
jgi:hypothetical protein